MNSKEFYIESKEGDRRILPLVRNSNEESIRMAKDVINKNGYGIKENIDTELFNKCTRDFVETQNGRFVHNVKSEVTMFEINHLKNQNALLKQLIAELSHENSMLKNRVLNGSKLKISGE